MSSLLELLLDLEVTVEISGLRIRGYLVAVSESRKGKDHRPYVLVLETPAEQHLVRGWDIIREWRSREYGPG